MSQTLQVILYASAAGLPIIVGGLVSSYAYPRTWGLKKEVNHWLIAFGGGVLLSAIAFALIPRGMEVLGLWQLVAVFLSGTVSFMLLDILSSKMGGSFAQLISMMMDFIPEALALGATFAYDPSMGLLLAVFIGFQNLPEGYNSYIELRKRLSASSTLWLMFGLSLTGIFAALLGVWLLVDAPVVVSMIMMYAAGGILYLIFQDIAPLSHLKNDWIPATGASFGFLVGIVGEKLI